LSSTYMEMRLDKSDKTKIIILKLMEIYEYLPWIWLQ